MKIILKNKMGVEMKSLERIAEEKIRKRNRDNILVLLKREFGGVK